MDDSIDLLLIAIILIALILHLLLLDDAVHGNIVDGEVLELSPISQVVIDQLEFVVVNAVRQEVLLRVRPGGRREQGVYCYPNQTLYITTILLHCVLDH